MDRDTFIGRQPELERLEHQLAAARAGNGSVVLVDAGPGMGKTALAHELTRRTRARGVVAAWGATRATIRRASVLGREVQLGVLGELAGCPPPRLHIAERTAENHVRNILDKLGFDSRTRIAAWYARRTVNR